MAPAEMMSACSIRLEAVVADADAPRFEVELDPRVGLIVCALPIGPSVVNQLVTLVIAVARRTDRDYALRVRLIMPKNLQVNMHKKTKSVLHPAVCLADSVDKNTDP